MAELDIGILAGQILLGIIIIGIILSGIRIIRPTNRAAIETLGKYTRFQNSGITFIMPFVQKLYSVNITEQLVLTITLHSKNKNKQTNTFEERQLPKVIQIFSCLTQHYK